MGVVAAAPGILDGQLRKLGLTCEIGRLELSLLTGELELGHVVVAPVEGGEPFVNLGYLRADIGVLSLLRGKVVVRRLELDGLDVLVDREANGRLAIEERIAAHIGSATETAKKPEPEKKKSDSAPPSIVVEALRVSHVHVHWRDQSVQPPLDAKLELELRVLDLAPFAPQSRPANVELQVACPPVLDAFRVEGDVVPDTTDAGGRASLGVTLDRLHLAPLAPYLEKARIRPYAKDLSFGLALDGRFHGTAGVATLSNVALTADGHEALALDALGVEVRSVSPEVVEIARIIIDGVRAEAAHLPDASIRVAGLELRPPKPSEGAMPVEEEAPSPALPRSAGEGDPPPKLVLDELAIRNVKAGFTDEGTRADLALVLEELALRGLDQRDPAKKATLAVKLAAPNAIESVTLDGEATPFAAAPALHAVLKGQRTTLRALEPFLKPAGIEPLLADGELRLTLDAKGRKGRALEADVTLSDVAFLEGDRALAQIAAVKLKDAKIDPEENHIQIAGIRVEAPRLAPIEKDASGALVACGLRIVPQIPAAPVPEPKPLPERARSGRVGKPLHLELGSLRVEKIQASFHDESVAPVASLGIADAGVELGAIDLDLAPDAKRPAATALHAWLAAPGLVEKVAITGSLVASAKEPSLTLGLDAKGVTAKAAEAYLAKAGVASQLQDGHFELALEADATVDRAGSLGANLLVEKVHFGDGADELFALEGIHVERVKLDTRKLDRVDVKLVALDKLHTKAATGPGGVLSALGFHVSPVASKPEPEVAGSRKPASEPGPQPLVRVEKLRVGDVRLDLHEASEEPAFDLPLKAGLELGPLAFDASGRSPLEDAPYRVTLNAPGALESLVLSGSLAVSPVAARLSGKLETTGITARALKARLATKGIEPLLDAGSLRLGVEAIASFEKGEAFADLHVKDVVYADKSELAGIDAIDVTGVHASAGKLAIGAVKIVRPRSHAARDAQGALLAGGFKLAHADRPERGPREARPESKDTPKPAAKEPFVFTLDALTLSKAGVAWSDSAVAPGVDVSLATDLSLTGVVLGSEHSAPAKLSLTVKAPGALDALTLAGTLLTRPAEMRADLALDLDGVRPGPLAPYLGEIRSELHEGALHADLSARLEPREGSLGASLAFEKVVWRDRDTELLRVDALRVKAPDLGAENVKVDEITLEGVTTRIEKTPAGETRLLGLVLPAGAPPPPDAPPKEKPRIRVARAAEKLHKREKLPLIALDKLDLRVKKVSYLDRSQPGAEPLVVSDLRVQATKPIRLLGPDPASQPPIELRLSTEVIPIASSVVVEARLAPFAQEPDFAVALMIDGLRGAGLTRVQPRLAEKLDGAQLTDGHVRAQAMLDLRTGRRDPLDFSALGESFGADVLVRGVSVREGANGRVLAGLDELHADIARIDSLGAVHVRALEVAKPAGWIQKEKDGLRVLDILLKPGPEAAPATSATEAKPAETTAAKPAPPGPEKRIDRITLTDIDFTFADVSTETSMVVPLTGLDVTLSQVTTKALEEHRTVRFDAVVKGGSTLLPKHLKKDAIPGTSALMGLLGDMKNVVTGEKKKARETEARRVFQEVAVRGELALVPNLDGWIDASVEGLELLNLKGPASSNRVVIEDGLFDTDVKLRWSPAGDLMFRSSTFFTDLDVAEPDDGWLREKLHLKFPLNAVVFALRDEDGSVEIPLNVPIPALSSEMSPSQKLLHLAPRLWAALTETLAEMTAKAVLHSPLRVLNSAADLGKGIVGLVPGSDVLSIFGSKKVEIEPVVLHFAPADPSPTRADLERLAPLVEKLEDDDKLVVTLRHEVGGGDLARERVAANPSPRDRRALLARLEARRANLERERLAALADVRTALAASLSDDAAQARGRVRDLEGELATVERACEQVYDLERDGAERQADRRTRAACVELGKARLEAIRTAIARQLPADQAERVRVSRPRVEERSGSEGGSVTVTVSQSRKR